MATKPRTRPYEINRELVLSTAHIPYSDAQAFDGAAKDKQLKMQLWWMDNIDFGYRILVNEDIVAEIITCGLSAALLDLVKLARKLKCKWLVLDADGGIHSNLPEFEW